ncbi:hypothetical protein E2320_011998, partial [Naja naja]
MQKMLNFGFLLLICLANLQPSSCQADRRNAIISAMEKAVMFLGENHDKVNMVLEKWQGQLEFTIEWQRMLMVREKLLTFMKDAAQDVEKQDPVSHKEFAPALKPGFWKVPQEWKKINESIPYSLTSGNCLDLKNNNCTSLMVNAHCDGYSLSHQLFYFLFAKMQSCHNSLFQNAGYYENMFFMFCGLAGFSEFFQTSWLERILNWQKQEKGCFWM